MRRRMSLAGQLLALQLVIISVVLIGVAAVSVAQSITRFQETEGRRALVVAETVAGTASVRGPLEDLDISSIAKSSDGTSTAGLGAVRTVAETNRTVSTSTYVIVADENGVIVASPEPAQIGTKL